MKTIKLKFVDYWDGFDVQNSLMYRRLSLYYNIELSEEPDYIVYSVFGNEHLKYKNCIKICYIGENISPEFNFCDYAIGFDYIDFEDRYLRFPIYYMLYETDMLLCEKKHLNNDNILKEKKEFCSFVYSNGNANPCREAFFHKLSEYKKVNSGGRYLNNVDMPNGVPDKLEFQSKHKFAIAYENSSRHGYSTEKIVQAFAAKTIPIYWGDPRIKEIFNPKSFICAMDYESIDDLISKVKEIDCSDDLYMDMINQPALLSEDYSQNTQLSVLDEWLRNIFDQDKDKAYRRNMDYFGKNYQDIAMDKEKTLRNPLIYIKRYITKIYR